MFAAIVGDGIGQKLRMPPRPYPTAEPSPTSTPGEVLRDFVDALVFALPQLPNTQGD